jgi:hypothetical protein
MIASVIATCLLFVVVLLTPAAAVAVDCRAAAAATTPTLLEESAADEVGLLRSKFRRAVAALAECPDSEPLWYEVVRGAELHVGNFPLTIGTRTFEAPIEAAHEAAVRAPRSARIATVLARLDSSVESARRAVALDATWGPARLALAAALSAQGSNIEADAILADMSATKSVPGANTARARILMARGKPKEAAALARRDLGDQWFDAPEPYLMSTVRRDAMETLGLALLAANRPKQAAPHLKAAAGLGSARATIALKSLRQ